MIGFLIDSAADEQGSVDEFDLDLTKATGVNDDKKDATTSKLSKVFQLSGFSDPVYAEAYVHVHQYDITLDGKSRVFVLVPALMRSLMY